MTKQLKCFPTSRRICIKTKTLNVVIAGIMGSLYHLYVNKQFSQHLLSIAVLFCMNFSFCSLKTLQTSTCRTDTLTICSLWFECMVLLCKICDAVFTSCCSAPPSQQHDMNIWLFISWAVVIMSHCVLVLVLLVMKLHQSAASSNQDQGPVIVVLKL